MADASNGHSEYNFKGASDHATMIYFFRRAAEALTCETRLKPDGDGCELVVTERGLPRIEAFATVAAMLSREHELLQAWRAQGWQNVGPKKRRGPGRTETSDADRLSERTGCF